MRQRRETLAHPFGTMQRLQNLRTEMALSVLGYNLTRVMNIIGIRPPIQAMGA